MCMNVKTFHDFLFYTYLFLNIDFCNVLSNDSSLEKEEKRKEKDVEEKHFYKIYFILAMDFISSHESTQAIFARS